MAISSNSGVRVDPFQGYKYIVNITNSSTNSGNASDKIAFSSVSSLVAEVEEVEYREGDDPVTMRKFPGLVTFENITFERGLTTSKELEDWFNQVVNIAKIGNTGGNGSQGDPQFRRTITIELIGRDGKTNKKWSVVNAWPKRLEIAEMDASSSDVLIQTMEIVHEGVYLSS